VASEVTTDDPATREEALALVLECGTEAGRIDRALVAWRQLEAVGWDHPRRSWLGRRLGVALARLGADDRVIDGVAAALPEHERCLRFWQSLARSESGALTDLASAPIHDLYGRWASIEVPGGGRRPYEPADPVGAAEPTPAVAWLLENAGPAEASDEWQRLFGLRRPTRSEAVAAAELAEHAGRANTAIRLILVGFPEMASTAIAVSPVDAASAYLPLRYSDHLVAAADRFGLDPWLLAALARQESTFIAHARSPAGARGVLQLLPSTARMHSRALGLGSRPDLEDPAINIYLGARELATLIRKYGALEPALAAYNAGERRVRRWWRRWPDPEVFSESVPIPETYSYIRRVVFLSDAYRRIHAQAWGEKP
jgi:soluble lytic murein transglycosylase-like protein